MSDTELTFLDFNWDDLESPPTKLDPIQENRFLGLHNVSDSFSILQSDCASRATALQLTNEELLPGVPTALLHNAGYAASRDEPYVDFEADSSPYLALQLPIVYCAIPDVPYEQATNWTQDHHDDYVKAVLVWLRSSMAHAASHGATLLVLSLDNPLFLVNPFGINESIVRSKAFKGINSIVFAALLRCVLNEYPSITVKGLVTFDDTALTVYSKLLREVFDLPIPTIQGIISGNQRFVPSLNVRNHKDGEEPDFSVKTGHIAPYNGRESERRGVYVVSIILDQSPITVNEASDFIPMYERPEQTGIEASRIDLQQQQAVPQPHHATLAQCNALIRQLQKKPTSVDIDLIKSTYYEAILLGFNTDDSYKPFWREIEVYVRPDLTLRSFFGRLFFRFMRLFRKESKPPAFTVVNATNSQVPQRDVSEFDAHLTPVLAVANDMNVDQSVNPTGTSAIENTRS